MEPDSNSNNVDGDQEQLDDEPKNIILEMIKQLRYGMDLHKVTFPTFVLEYRSMLERISDFLAHPELIIKTSLKQDPVERFVDIVRFFMSGWHIRTKGVKKPYNPVLGEYFRCKWLMDDGTKCIYLAEQVTHHPPCSAFFYASPENNIIINGYISPKSKFLGNSVASILEGRFILNFTNIPGEEYVITLPNMYARGILFGTMIYEVSDNCRITCEANDLVADIEFKSKGYFTGTYNAVQGSIKKGGEAIYKLNGKWSDVMNIQPLKSKSTEVLFDATNAKARPKAVPSEDQQGQFESRKLWTDLTKSLKERNHDAATEAKTKVEDQQRKYRAIREEKNIEWKPQHFYLDENGIDWICKYSKKQPFTKEYLEEIETIIFNQIKDPDMVNGEDSGKE